MISLYTSLSAHQDMPELNWHALNECRSYAMAIVVINCDYYCVQLIQGHARAKLAYFE